ncbi:hypothetical protein [Thermaurantiacus sp.]
MVEDFASLAARIAADARFGRVAARLCDDVLSFYATTPGAMRLLGDQGQMRVLVICYHLHPDIRLAAVQKLTPAEVASPNRVAAALKLLTGQQALLPGEGTDRRARPLRLSPGGQALAEAFLMMMVGAGAPFAGARLSRDHCRAYASDYLLATLAGGGGIRAGPVAERTQTLKGGALLSLELMRRGLDPDDPTPFSRKGFAARFGMSRAQVIALLAALEEAGWATLADGRLQPTPLAMEGGRVWLSRFLAISATVLDGRFGEVVAASRARRAAERMAAQARTTSAG